LRDDNFAPSQQRSRKADGLQQYRKGDALHAADECCQALVILVAIVAGFYRADYRAADSSGFNMVTSVALGLVISFEPHELDVMQRPPRASDRGILDGFGLWRVIFVGLGCSR